MRGLLGARLVVILVIGGAPWRSASSLLLLAGSNRNRCNQHRRNVPPLSSLTPTEYDGRVRWHVEDTALEGHGVTALLALGSAPINSPRARSTTETTATAKAVPESLMVGTKRGQIFRLRTNRSDGRFFPADELSIQDDDGPPASSAARSKLPIYCFASPRPSFREREETILLVGGADRFVSVHRLPTEFDREDCGEPGGEAKANSLKPSIESLKSLPSHDRVLRRIRKLGPHTGWVKDMVLIDGYALDDVVGSRVSPSCTLYSIGCNGIEIWKLFGRESDTCAAREEGRDDAPWRRVGKWSIESSALGCTLSSDLLCLAAQGSDAANGRVWAGGVDGRIHGWWTDRSHISNRRVRVNADDTCVSWVAHQGRVTQLVTYKNRFLFSSSHDGTIKCWAISSGRSPPSIAAAIPRSVSTLEIGSEDRVTALSLLSGGSQKAGSATMWLAFGTQNGLVGLSRLVVPESSDDDDDDDDDDVDECDHKWSLLGQLQLPVDPPIHCLCPLGPTLLAVGHANGLTSVSWNPQDV